MMHTQMSRLDMAELAEMEVTDRYPIRHHSRCQYESEFYTLHVPVKQTYKNTKCTHQYQ